MALQLEDLSVGVVWTFQNGVESIAQQLAEFAEHNQEISPIEAICNGLHYPELFS